MEIIHIHSNPTFIKDTLKYIHPKINNKIIFIGEKSDKLLNILNTIGIKYIIFPKTKDTIDKIAQYSRESNTIVINDLDEFKIQLLFKLRPHQKKILRLFGHELYGLYPNIFLSEKSFKNLYPEKLMHISILNLLKKRKDKWKRKKSIKQKLLNQKDIYNKFSAILLVNNFEHKDLIKYFHLPQLIKIPLIQEAIKLKNKTNTIIFGNSQHPWNNHLDIIDELKKIEIKDISIKCFFNYGGGTAYSKKVEEASKEIPAIELIKNFLPIEEFNEIYETASALVINSYRQHALGNIFTALISGCKIYLNKRSSTYQWLKSEGFIISEVSELANDIQSHNYQLSIEQQQFNREKYSAYQKSYTREDFINEIIKVVESKL